MYTVSQTAKLLNVSDYVVRQKSNAEAKAYMFGHNLRIDPVTLRSTARNNSSM